MHVEFRRVGCWAVRVRERDLHAVAMLQAQGWVLGCERERERRCSHVAGSGLGVGL